MSTRKRLGRAAVVALALGGTGACVDPNARFEDFEQRVLDADTSGGNGTGGLFDISGEFLATIAPGFMPDFQLQFLTTIDYSPVGGGATVNFSFQPLHASNCPDFEARVPVGDPLVMDDVGVDSLGQFELTIEGAEVDGLANAVSCGDILADITLIGVIKSEDLFCGTAGGMVMMPTPASLEGSTLGAVRVEPDTPAEDLPEPLAACPAE